MTTQQILNLDLRDEENKKIIQKVLKKIKPLSKCSDENVSLEKIEKTIMVMCKKYDFNFIIYVDKNAAEKALIYRVEIINNKLLKKVERVYGITIYEALSKAAIKIYSEIKRANK